MRNQALDVLRGVAILLVLGYHYGYFRLWARCGWAGVDLFFVLSGFLISGLLFSEYKKYGSIDLMHFWIRRGFKIYPAFYVLIAFTCATSLVATGTIPKSILGDVFFVQNYAPHVWPHGWSLAVEEHFYLILPLLLLVMMKRSRVKSDPFSSVPLVFICVAVGCLGLRILGVARHAPLDAIQLPTHLRIDSLFAGVALGYCRHFRPALFDRFARKPLWIPGIVLFIPTLLLPLGSPVIETVGFTGLYLGFGCIVAWSVVREPSRSPITRFAAWTGRYSYSIYLWHLPLGVFLFSGSPNLISFVLYCAAAIGLGAGMSWLIEIPFLSLRDRLFPRRAPVPVRVAAELTTL